MKKEYDFSNSKKNPYAKELKSRATIRLDKDVIKYFKKLAKDKCVPYQTLIISRNGRKIDASQVAILRNWVRK